MGCSPPGVPDPLGTYSGSDIYPEDADYEGGENGPALPGSSGSPGER